MHPGRPAGLSHCWKSETKHAPLPTVLLKKEKKSQAITVKRFRQNRKAFFCQMRNKWNTFITETKNETLKWLTLQFPSSSADRMMVPHFFPGIPLRKHTQQVSVAAGRQLRHRHLDYLFHYCTLPFSHSLKVFISTFLVKSGATLVILSRPHPQSRHNSLAKPEVTLLMQNKKGKVFDGKAEGTLKGQLDASNEHITVPPLR